MIFPTRWGTALPLRWLCYVAPALVVTTAMFLYATLGLLHPLSLVGLGIVALVFVWLTLARAPALLFGLFPLSMVFFVNSWIEPHDVLLVGLAVAGLLATRVHWQRLKLEVVEWRYLIFITAMATTLFGPYDLRRFLAAVKLASFGLLAFEVARFAARRYGRATLAWGSATFAALTAFMLFIRGARMGLNSLLNMNLRGLTSELPWGRSNYVAAVLVICLPMVWFLLQLHAQDRRRRTTALIILVAMIGGILLTTSRGGLLLSTGFLLAAGRRLRRGGWVALLATALVAGALLLTPFGEFVLARFTTARGLESAVARPLGWMWAFQRGMEHLPFGVGAGQGLLQSDRLADADPHNYYLTLFSEGGPLSLLLWLWLLAGVWRAGGALLRNAETAEAGRALRGMLLLAAANALIEPTFTGSLYGTLFWWVAGTLHGADRIPPPPASTVAAPVRP